MRFNQTNLQKNDYISTKKININTFSNTESSYTYTVIKNLTNLSSKNCSS